MINLSIEKFPDENEYLVRDQLGDCLGAISKNKNGSYSTYKDGRKIGETLTVKDAALLTLSEFVFIEHTTINDGNKA
jgi:hypothetical protein